MTAIAAQTLGCVCLLLVAGQYRPQIPGVALYAPRDFPRPVYVSDLSVPFAAVIAAAPSGDADILDGGGHLPMTTGEFVAMVTADHAADAADLDAIETSLLAELDWVISSALLWLDADPETEHDLASLADYPGDAALREQVLAHA